MGKRQASTPIGFRIEAVHTDKSNFRQGFIKMVEVEGLDTETLHPTREDALAANMAAAKAYAAANGLDGPVKMMSASAPTGLGFVMSDVLFLVKNIYSEAVR